ncbi:MAG: BatD family protein [Nitrospirales bacterium]
MVGEQGKRQEGLMVGVFNLSILIFVWSALGGPSSVWAQSVKAYVDRNPVMADETVRLVVEAEGVSSGEAPDLKKLDENFALLGTSHSQQMSIVNMKTSSVTKWVTTLAPKRTGMLTIPAIQVGHHSSLPFTLTVKEPSQMTAAGSQRNIYLEAEVDSHVPYVQGQVLLTLRLLSAVSLQEGKLDDPEIEWGMVERVGKDRSFETIREGRRYQVTERRFAITPQKAGTQIIPPVLLSGSIPDERPGGSMLDEFFSNRRRGQSGGPFTSLFQTTRPIHLRSPKVSLTVKDMPADTKGKMWLPAKEFTIKESWSGDTENIQMHEPLTRTVVMVAKGLRGEQLPELPVQDFGSVKIYPDKPETTTEVDDTWVVGTREEKYAFVPTQPGSVAVPGIRIPWWNIEAARWETAELPSRTLRVRGDFPTQSARVLDQHPSDFLQSVPSDEQSPLNGSRDSSKPSPMFLEPTQWPWLVGGLLGIWVLTLVGWWWDRRRRKHFGREETGARVQKALESERKAIQAVKAACQEQSAIKARQALLQWASIKQQGKPCLSLGTAVRMLAEPVPNNTGVKEAIWNLDRTLYTTPESHTWDGHRFWETIQPAMTAKSPTIKNKNESLPELYLH